MKANVTPVDDPVGVLEWVRQTVEGIVSGDVDPHWGANHIWKRRWANLLTWGDCGL